MTTLNDDLWFEANEPLDRPHSDYIFTRIREMRQAGVSFNEATKAAFAECGKEFQL
jgi:hypothetical protein